MDKKYDDIWMIGWTGKNRKMVKWIYKWMDRQKNWMDGWMD